jgi:hypothetical protein
VLKTLKNQQMFKFLLMLSVCSAASFQAWRALFNNFAVDFVKISSDGVGLSQSVREIPGLLALLAIYFLTFMKEHRLAAYSIILMGVGVMLTPFFPSLTGLLLTTFIMSWGFHYFETANQSLSLQYFDERESPYVLAAFRQFNALSCIVAGVVIWVMGHLFTDYMPMYLVAGTLALIGGVLALRKDPTVTGLVPQKPKMVFKKKYWLFYVLTLISGARRQVFIVFSVYLLVKKFGFSVTAMTILLTAENALNFLVLPGLARAIRYWSEKRVLMAEAMGVIFIFLVYAYVETAWIAVVVYLVDSMLYNVSIAIRTYFQKIADTEDIATSTAVSNTINHIAAVIIPVSGGLLWKFDYKMVFMVGSVLGLMTLFFCLFMPSSPAPHFLRSFCRKSVRPPVNEVET